MVLYRPSKHKLCELIPCAIAVLVLLCIICAVAAVIVGVLVAKPGLLAHDFKAATCRPVSNGATYKAQMSCDCSGIHSDNPHCKSSFPCYQIMVQYEPKRTIIRHNESDLYFKNEAIIHETESDFSSLYSQCSFQHCNPEYETNKILADDFRNRIRIADAFSCFYNPNKLDQVIVTKRYNATQVLLALILPGGFFLLFLAILIGICVLQHRKVQEKSRCAQDERTSAARNYLGRDMPSVEPDERVENTHPLPDPFASINDMLSSQSDTVGKSKHETSDHSDPQADDISHSRGEHVEIDGIEEESEQIALQFTQMSTVM